MLQARAARLNSAVDRKAGVLLRLVPKREKDNWGNAIGADDRQPREIIGTFFEGGPAIAFLDGDRTNREFTARTAEEAFAASFDPSVFATEPIPEKNDILQTLFEVTPRDFRVVAVAPTSWRTILKLAVA